MLKTEGAQALFATLISHCPLLSHLHIPGNEIELDEDLEEMILASLLNKSNLEEVNLKDNEIEQDMYGSLVDALPRVAWQFESDEEESEDDAPVLPSKPIEAPAVPMFPYFGASFASAPIAQAKPGQPSSLFTQPLNSFAPAPIA